MSVSWKVSGAPLTVSATTATLPAVMAAAQPGTVINVTFNPTPVAFNFANIVKRDPGIFVRFDDQQVYYITTGSAQNAGITFIGGRASYDLVTFAPTSTINYGIFLGPNTSRIRLQSILFDQSRDAINLQRTTDVDIESCVLQFALNDCIKGSSPRRIRINNSISTVICSSWTMGYYNDGRPPVYGEPISFVNSSGGKFLDTSHSDFVQFFRDTGVSDLRYGAEDVTITNCEYDMDGQGIVNAGFSSVEGLGDGDEIWNRALLANNLCRSTFPGNIFLSGTDIEVRNNAVESSALYDMLFGNTTATLATFSPLPEWMTSARFRGGQNTVAGLGQFRAPGAFIGTDALGATVTQTTAAIFAGPGSETINGDTVNPPEAPRIAPIPAWVTVPARPSNVLPAVVPLNIIPPEIVWWGGPYDGSTVTPTVGTYLSARRGIWRAGKRNGPVAYRWLRNGTPISGATSPLYQVTADDVGQQIVLEVVHTNDVGPSLPALSTAIVPV